MSRLVGLLKHSLALVALLAVLDAVSAPPTASAATLSPGCTSRNAPSNDGLYSSLETGGASYFAGETLVISAQFDAGSPPQSFELQVGGEVVATSAVPGTIFYTFPADVTVALFWRNTSNVSTRWTVDCVAAGVATAVDSDQDHYCNRGATSAVCLGPDTCPRTAAGEAVDENGCSQAQVDSDLDGVCNRGVISSLCEGSDGCSRTPSGAAVDADGCVVTTVTLSPGCTSLNSASLDSLYSEAGSSLSSYFAGETLVMSTQLDAGSPPQSFELRVGGVVVATADVPGSIVYTFPADVSASPSWRNTRGLSTRWTVECVATGVATTVDSDLDHYCNRGATSVVCLGPDRCPGTSAGAEVDENGCSQVQVDSNLDGVCNRGATSIRWCGAGFIPPPAARLGAT